MHVINTIKIHKNAYLLYLYSIRIVVLSIILHGFYMNIRSIGNPSTIILLYIPINAHILGNYNKFDNNWL